MPGTTRAADRIAAVFRDCPADPDFGDDLAATVRDIRAWSDGEEQEQPTG